MEKFREKNKQAQTALEGNKRLQQEMLLDYITAELI